MGEGDAGERKDWVGNHRTYALAWGLPTGALLLALFLEPAARTAIWGVGLTWMGVACLANAARCGRTHCYFTGPFFLLMALAVVLHGTGIIWLGPSGWTWLGIVLVAGGFGCCGSYPNASWGNSWRLPEKEEGPDEFIVVLAAARSFGNASHEGGLL